MGIPPLVAELRAQTTQFTAEMAKAKAELRSVETAGNTSGAKFKDVVGKHFEDAGKSASGLTSQIQGMSPAMLGAAAGATAAGAAVAAFALDGAHKFVELAGEIRNFQRASGASAEESSRFVAALDDLGISSETGASAIFKLSKNAATGADKLRDVGIEVAHNRDGTANLTETLLNAADAYSKTNDPVKRTEIAFAAFGKQGQALIPVLEQGRAGLQKFFEGAQMGHQIMSQDDLDKARKFEMALDDLHDSFRGLQIEAGKALLPFLTTLAEAGTKTLGFVDQVAGRAGGLGGVLQSVAQGFSPLAGLVGVFSKGNKDAGDKSAVAAAQFAQQAAAAEELGVQVSDTEKSTGKLSEETKKAAAEAEKYKAQMEELAGSVQYGMLIMGRSTNALSDDQRDLAKRFDESRRAADQLKQGIDMLVGVHLTAQEAAIHWEQAIDDTTSKLRENKATLDITTEAGRQNQGVIIDMIQAGFGHIDALQREGASVETLRAAYGDHVAALRNVMRQAGYTDAQIDQLIGSYNLVPNLVETAIRAYGLEYVGDALDGIRHQLNALDGRTVTVFTNHQDVYHDDISHAFASGGQIPRAARGLRGFRTNGPTLVGEGNPLYPEYVIATDPQYRDRNLKLLAAAVAAMGGTGVASGAGGGWGSGAGGGTVVNNLNVYTATGDIPESTIRKLREQLARMGDDYVAGSLLPA